MRHSQFKSDPLPAKSAGTYLKCLKHLNMFFYQNPGLNALIRWYTIFLFNENPKPLSQYYSTTKIHQCVKYCLIPTFFAMLNVIPQLISVENHTSLYLVAHFCEGFFFVKTSITHVYNFFQVVSQIKRCHVKVFDFF